MHLNSECHIQLNRSATICSVSRMELNNVHLLIFNLSREKLAHGMKYVIQIKQISRIAIQLKSS
jgi:hypothetical protein